jgi:hypothetical protein
MQPIVRLEPTGYGSSMAITGNQIAAARALAQLSQTELARPPVSH